MFAKKALMSALIVVGTLGAATMSLPSMGETTVIELQAAPPAPYVERVPIVQRGYVYTPGYWDYQDNRYVWVPGATVIERPGFVYQPGRWVGRDNGRWILERGRWERIS